MWGTLKLYECVVAKKMHIALLGWCLIHNCWRQSAATGSDITVDNSMSTLQRMHVATKVTKGGGTICPEVMSRIKFNQFSSECVR